MNIDGFDFLRGDRLPCGNGSELAIKDGTLYHVFRCDAAMTESRAALVSAFFEKLIQKGSNIAKPLLFRMDGLWYSAVEYRSRFCEGMPIAYFRCFPEQLKTDIILTALAAVYTMARNRAVHGSLSPGQFRLILTENGFVISELIGGLAEIGCYGDEPISTNRISVWAPELLSGSSAPTRATDVFCMGVCCHVWLCGEFPRLKLTDNHTISDLYISSALDQTSQSILSAMLAINPDDRPTILQAIEAFREKRFDRSAGCFLYYDGELYTKESPFLWEALLPESEAFTRRYG